MSKFENSNPQAADDGRSQSFLKFSNRHLITYGGHIRNQIPDLLVG